MSATVHSLIQRRAEKALFELFAAAKTVQENAFVEEIEASRGAPAHRLYYLHEEEYDRLSEALDEISRLIETHPAEA